jgi:hypothetical protein
MKKFSFLQHFGGIHGIQLDQNLLEVDVKEILKVKYLEIKNAGNLIADISPSSNDNVNSTYVYSIHCIPKSNKIFEYINSSCNACLINSI